ncbi:zinc finger protein 600-like [Topomyia yanbarensis]|uniref:zinc finger protein 600-like n=1 Tax=Topomyia yanbarensis TaxID=2498891 RepID=UPI00273B90A0|nr:zinc finger protein 600-like [Topomyia yanbarensis]
MAIFNLNQFPDVCRLCVQSKPRDEMIFIETTTLENSNCNLLVLLNELTFEVSKNVSGLLPNVICPACFAVFEFVSQYQQKMKLLTKFLVALAHLKSGNESVIVELFTTDSTAITGLIKELSLCNKDEVRVEDLLAEFRSNNVEPIAEIKIEDSKVTSTLLESKNEYVEYYNVEYIEDDTQQKISHESKQQDESLTEFLDEIVEETEESIAEQSEVTLNHPRLPPKTKPKIRMLQCRYCTYRTTSKNMFQNHVDRHEKPDDDNPWKCSFAKCNAVYPTKEDLLKHKKEIHSKYVCDICGMVLKHKYTLEVHLRRHTGESKYPCQYCSTSYFTSNELKLHMTVVHLSVTDFHCNVCGLAFKSKKSLALHEKTHSGLRGFKCDECTMSFKTSAHLRRHHNTVHRAIKFCCTMCPTSYGRKDKLRMHIEKAHNIQTYFPCDICMKSFTSAEDLSEHEQHHRHPRDLECAICLVAFTSRKEFDDHLCITYRSDYICCNRDFKYHLHYNRHMFLVHGLKTNVRVKPAADQLLGAARAARKQVERCTNCEQIFATRKMKKEHMAVCAIVQFPGSSILSRDTKMNEDGVMQENSEARVTSVALSYPDVQSDLQHLTVKME